MPMHSVETWKLCVMDCISYERCQCIVFSTPHWMTVLILPTRTGDIFLQLEQFAFAALKKNLPRSGQLVIRWNGVRSVQRVNARQLFLVCYIFCA